MERSGLQRRIQAIARAELDSKLAFMSTKSISLVACFSIFPGVTTAVPHANQSIGRKAIETCVGLVHQIAATMEFLSLHSMALTVLCFQLALSGGAEIFKLRPVPPLPSSWDGWAQTFRDDRYNYHLSHIQFHAVPNFTETGFLLRQTPPELHAKLLKLFHEGYDGLDLTSLPSEAHVNILRTDDPSKKPVFLDIQRHTRDILAEMKPLHEEWADVELEPTFAFGLRVYQQGNVLKKHVDRLATHVISSIVHIASDVDEPWALVISDNQGVEHAVSLRPGQMLFYESAKLPHARPIPMKGRYYTSVFVHYKPKQWPFDEESHAQRHLNEHLVADWDRDTMPQPTSFEQEYELRQQRTHTEL
eukprot:TRINITY_DN11163_c0_g1_i1.p2 TRINITY_DN11163_c0_g1~~TRINITY_DN11163_c0_g1_i1.p2  ORF type:complete len:361 (+),score=51.14 TRINITY_DN11163_c0_g1_i1:1345-2427(+)